MQALRFHAARDVRIDEVPEPPVPGPTQVVVAPAWCGICGTDLHEYMDGPIVTPAPNPHPLTGATLPQIFGHEFSGEVVAVGTDVLSVAVGDRIALMPLVYCGRCPYCRRGLQQLCVTMGCVGLSHRWGGMAPLATVEDYMVVPLPDEVSLEQGSLLEPAAVAANSVERGGVVPGSSVLVAGAGPIGALVALCASAAGAAAVYLSEPNADRRARAAALGAADVIDPTAVDVPAYLRERTEGLGVDVAIECAGRPQALTACLRSVRKRGTVVQTGLHVGPASVEPMVWSENELTIIGTWCYSVHDFSRVAALVATGRLPVERVITRRVELGDAAIGAFADLASGGADDIKVLVSTKGA
jgi:(R,R)-butanediol dehydrogenase/meso-butanediol dehydrogenase/diacetyl reductase